MSEPLQRLIEALARADAEEYLRERAGNDGAGNPLPQNPGLPATGEAA